MNSGKFVNPATFHYAKNKQIQRDRNVLDGSKD